MPRDRRKDPRLFTRQMMRDTELDGEVNALSYAIGLLEGGCTPNEAIIYLHERQNAAKDRQRRLIRIIAAQCDWNRFVRRQ